jgi:carboxylesterase type B
MIKTIKMKSLASVACYLLLTALMATSPVASATSIGKCSRKDARHIQLNTTSGRLLGRCDFITVNDNNPRDIKSGNVYSWLGVPYAEPPINGNRFRAPVPITPRAELTDATSWASSCIQFPAAGDEDDSSAGKRFTGFAMWQPLNQSEDCLYLNIWAPAEAYLKLNTRRPNQPPAKLPILVFFHGGDTVRGTAAVDALNPATLAAATNSIVITVNYRLGVYGFIYLDGHFPGNQALLDQHEALRWINANAERLGGDANRVTLVGQGAGATLASYHMFYAESWPLFRSVILQSGSPLSSALQPITVAEATKRALTVLTYAGCVNETTSMMSEVVAKCAVNSPDVTQAAASYFQDLNKYNRISQAFTLTAFPPVVDGRVLQDLPAKLLRYGHFKKCPVLTGFNTGKLNFFSLKQISSSKK